MNDNMIDLGLVIVGSSGNRNVNGQTSNGSETATTESGDAPQAFDIQTVSKQRDEAQEAFKSQNNMKKPSSQDTYDAEVANNPDAQESFDLQEVAKQRQEIIDYNSEILANIQETEPLSPLVTDPLNFKAPGDDLTAGSSIGGLGKNVNGNAGAGLLDAGGLNNLTNKVAGKLKNTAVGALNKAVTALKQKRNELVRTFINDLEAKVGLKRIIPDNVYTNSDFLQNTINQLKADVGLTIGDAIISAATGN